MLQDMGADSVIEEKDGKEDYLHNRYSDGARNAERI
jgi:hypothetical protein